MVDEERADKVQEEMIRLVRQIQDETDRRDPLIRWARRLVRWWRKVRGH